MKEIYITFYTKEKGKLELDKKEWFDFPDNSVTFHSECGPAVVFTDGDEMYYINGKHHRENGPAVIYTNGYRAYCINGKLHREDGPAVIHGNTGHCTYWLNDKHYPKSLYYKKLEEIDNLPLSLKLIHEEEWIRKRAKK